METLVRSKCTTTVTLQCIFCGNPFTVPTRSRNRISCGEEECEIAKAERKKELNKKYQKNKKQSFKIMPVMKTNGYYAKMLKASEKREKENMKKYGTPHRITHI